jgi:arabinose-5-phosphate isomerase
LVIGDALAVALLECRGFSAQDFARYHPGGALGKRLYLRVADLYINNAKPVVNPESEINEVIIEISSNRLGCTAVVNNNLLAGIITDGDLRRMLQTRHDLSGVKAKDILCANPLTVTSDALVSDALDIMRTRNITQLLVVDSGTYLGVIHLHDILKEGII